jgi:glycosyltransferase 2 family protein
VGHGVVQAKQIISRLKPYLRWLILGGTLFFLAKVLKDHWQEVTAIQISQSGWGFLVGAFAITLAAHVWSGWVWSWILWEFDQPAGGWWGVRTYLKTNIAKYLPGNVWHFYGRIWAAKAAGIPLSIATLSVLMEPLLMAAAALVVALAGNLSQQWGLQIVSLAIVLLTVHPRLLNPLLQYLKRAKEKAQGKRTEESALQLKRYPLLPFLGELGFLLLRGAGFLMTLMALHPVELTQVPLLLSSFSFAWLLGLVVPGAPGGLGVFEATAIALLNRSFSPGMILSLVALYRLISILAEAGGAGLAWLSERGKIQQSPAEDSDQI